MQVPFSWAIVGISEEIGGNKSCPENDVKVVSGSFEKSWFVKGCGSFTSPVIRVLVKKVCDSIRSEDVGLTMTTDDVVSIKMLSRYSLMLRLVPP